MMERVVVQLIVVVDSPVNIARHLDIFTEITRFRHKEFEKIVKNILFGIRYGHRSILLSFRKFCKTVWKIFRGIVTS